MIEKDDMVCLSYQRNRRFEDLSIQKWLEYLKEGMTAVDIGSYSGLYAILAAKTCKSIAIEPNPVMVSRIAQNASNNEVEIEIINAAAGSKDGYCSIKSRFPTSSATKVVEGDQIPIIRANFPNVCAMKIDVEGMEMDVLMGVETLPPLVIAESLDDKSEQDLIYLMEGYSVVRDERNLIFERSLCS